METYTLGYKFRIYPNRTQENLINRTLGCARFVFNHFLAVSRQANCSPTSRSARKLDGCLKWTAWHCRNPCGILIAHFRTSLQSGQDTHASSLQSYRTRNQTNGIRIIGKRIKLPKLGLVRIKQSRDFGGRILSATVSRAASGKYYLSLCVEVERESLSCPN
uniref:helix-turn-helix domain-containing protein n=1 Tax=Mitsuokella multacida TaxID=52226 RepID=UPI0022E3981C